MGAWGPASGGEHRWSSILEDYNQRDTWIQAKHHRIDVWYLLYSLYNNPQSPSDICNMSYVKRGFTWHLISMLKKSSLGSWWSPSPTRCPRLLWVILRPGRLPTLTRWSSRRRLWELAIKSNSSSVWGEVVIEGSRRREKIPVRSNMSDVLMLRGSSKEQFVKKKRKKRKKKPEFEGCYAVNKAQLNQTEASEDCWIPDRGGTQPLRRSDTSKKKHRIQ